MRIAPSIGIGTRPPAGWLLRLGRHQNPVRVMIYLMSLQPDSSGRVWASRREIARELNVKKIEHVDKALNKLEEEQIVLRGDEAVRAHYRPHTPVPFTIAINHGAGEVTVHHG
jgi:hypothetical protein